MSEPKTDAAVRPDPAGIPVAVESASEAPGDGAARPADLEGAAENGAAENGAAENGAAGDGEVAALTILAEPADVTDVAKAVAKEVEKRRRKARKKAKKDKGKKESLGTSRGIETMFRTSYRTHLDLTSLADAKANIMISVNGLILPILLGAISSKIDTNPWLIIPTAVFVTGCLISMVYAIRAARPRVTKEPITLDDVRSDDVNVLFFGNYTSLSRDDFEVGLTELITDTDRLYKNMMRDIYGIGSVLQTKFHLLRTSYTAFGFAVVSGVLLFLAVYVAVGTGMIGGAEVAAPPPAAPEGSGLPGVLPF